MSINYLFDIEKNESFNLAKVAVLLNANKGKFLGNTEIQTESKLIGFKSPFPDGYGDYTNWFTQKYGLQYSVDTKKGEVVYRTFPTKDKLRNYTISEILQSSHSTQELFLTAKRMAQNSAQSTFRFYQNEFYHRIMDSDIIEKMVQRLVEKLNLGRYNASIKPQDLYQGTKGVHYSGLNIRLYIEDSRFGFRYGQDANFINIHSTLNTDGVWLTYQEFGYGKLNEHQIEGMAMAMQKKLYEFFCEQYPTAVVVLYKATDGTLGMNIMDLEENYLS